MKYQKYSRRRCHSMVNWQKHCQDIPKQMQTHTHSVWTSFFMGVYKHIHTITQIQIQMQKQSFTCNAGKGWCSSRGSRTWRIWYATFRTYISGHISYCGGLFYGLAADCFLFFRLFFCLKYICFYFAFKTMVVLLLLARTGSLLWLSLHSGQHMLAAGWRHTNSAILEAV